MFAHRRHCANKRRRPGEHTSVPLFTLFMRKESGCRKTQQPPTGKNDIRWNYTTQGGPGQTYSP